MSEDGCAACEAEATAEAPVYTESQLQELTTSLNWHAAILAVLLQEAGGAVEVKKSDIEAINLKTAMVNISHKEEEDTFLIEAVEVTSES